MKKLEGRKDDTGKSPWHLLPFDALEQVCKVLEHGQKKYDARNWEKGMDWSRIHGATNRHLNRDWWQDGIDTDPDSGLSHLAHAACDTLFLLAYALRGAGNDDRPGKEAA
jgi:hypothetical protein